MFVVHLSYGSTLQLIAERCRLPLVSTIDEVGHDGSLLHGIEIELPLLFDNETPRRQFFWSSVQSNLHHPYEHACLQAIIFLQNLYRFAIVDFNYHTMVRQELLIRQLFSLVNRGANLARVVTGTVHSDALCATDALHVADQLLAELQRMVDAEPVLYS